MRISNTSPRSRNELPPVTAWAAPRATAAPSKCGLRVLIVDDEDDVLAGLVATLSGAGFATVAAGSLARATEALLHEQFDLVLTDLYLGDSGFGYQLADVARSQTPPVPVVLMTGRPSFHGAQAAIRTHVADIVVKPADPTTLLTTCRRVVEETALARRNAELVLENELLASVMGKAIEAKDPTTSGHAERVVGYTDALAQRLGVGDCDREALRLAALLHDVGKIGVPDAILTKPGGLTAAEREVVNQHPRLGYTMLEPLRHHPNTRLWVYQHHERWDGGGYPEGLKGEEVALPGRLLILSEVYDALAEARSYKPAWPLAKIVAFFRDQAGRHFDPDLANLVADGLERMGSRFFAARPGLLF
jgi:putative two-component system response regulator